MLPDKDGPGVGGGHSAPGGEDLSVSLFREYLRVKTVHPDPDYGETSSSQDADVPRGINQNSRWNPRPLYTIYFI